MKNFQQNDTYKYYFGITFIFKFQKKRQNGKKIWSILEAETPIFISAKAKNIFWVREVHPNEMLTRSCDDPFNSDKILAESDLIGQLNT